MDSARDIDNVLTIIVFETGDFSTMLGNRRFNNLSRLPSHLNMALDQLKTHVSDGLVLALLEH